MNIFIKSWNVQSNRYEEKDTEFINKLTTHLLKPSSEGKQRYQLIVIGYQEDCMSSFIGGYESPLMNLIKAQLEPVYKLINSIKLPGWGVTTFKYLKQGIYQPRGLNLAVFGHTDFLNNIKVESETLSLTCPDIKNMITFGKGCVGINLKILGEKETNITFLNMHLPFSSSSLIDTTKRKAAREWQGYCLKYFYENAIIKFNSTFLFLFGDMNFRIQNNKVIKTSLITSYSSYISKTMTAKPNLDELLELDELNVLTSYADCNNNPIPRLIEGINGQGPLFYPTSKLDEKRNYKYGKYKQRYPSWCDRILYTSTKDSLPSIKCLTYDNWDYEKMTESDHSAVIGTFVINI